MNKTEKEGVKHHGNVGRTAFSKFKMRKFVDKQYGLLWVGQGSRTDYVVLEKGARGTVSALSWADKKGWLLGGFGQGLHCRTGKEEAPRLILFWEAAAIPLKEMEEPWEEPFLQKDCGNEGRKDGGAPCSSPVLGEQGHCSLCNCDLPCPLHNFISLFLTT